MDNSGHPLQSGGHQQQGQGNGNQPQMNQFQQMQNFQQQFQNLQSNNMNMAMNQSSQGGQMNWPMSMPNQNQLSCANNNNNIIMGQLTNGGQNNQFNQMNWHQQSHNQPVGGGSQLSQLAGIGLDNTSTSNGLMNTNNAPFPGMPQASPAGGGTQNANSSAPASLNQQQVQAQTALFWNAFRASQGQIGNQGGQNSFPSDGGTNLQMGNFQMNAGQQGMMGNSAQAQMNQGGPQAKTALNAFNNWGGNSEGNLNGSQGFNQMNQLQAQVSNQMQQTSQHDSNGRPSSSFSTNNNSNNNGIILQLPQQQQQLLNSPPGNFINANFNTNQVPNPQQGTMGAAVNPNRGPNNRDSHQSTLLNQFIQNQHGTMTVNGVDGNGMNNMQNYLKQLQDMQQKFTGNTGTGVNVLSDEIQGLLSTSAYPVQTDQGLPNSMGQLQMQQIQDMMASSQGMNVSRNSSNKEAAPRNSMQADSLSHLLNPDPIVTGGKVHATSFPVLAMPDGNILPDGQIEGEIVNVQVQGICVQGGNANGSIGRFLDGNFAGGWQSNADLPERKKAILRYVE
jgi:hypothetical protein